MKDKMTGRVDIVIFEKIAKKKVRLKSKDLKKHNFYIFRVI